MNFNIAFITFGSLNKVLRSRCQTGQISWSNALLCWNLQQKQSIGEAASTQSPQTSPNIMDRPTRLHLPIGFCHMVTIFRLPIRGKISIHIVPAKSIALLIAIRWHHFLISREIRDLPNTVTPNSYSLFSSCTGRLTYWNWSAKTAEQWRREMHTSNCWHSHHELDPNLAGFRLYKHLPFALFPCKNRSIPGAPTLKFYFNSKISTTLKRSHFPRTLLVYWWDRKLHAHDISGNMTRH